MEGEVGVSGLDEGECAEIAGGFDYGDCSMNSHGYFGQEIGNKERTSTRYFITSNILDSDYFGSMQEFNFSSKGDSSNLTRHSSQPLPHAKFPLLLFFAKLFSQSPTRPIAKLSSLNSSMKRLPGLYNLSKPQ